MPSCEGGEGFGEVGAVQLLGSELSMYESGKGLSEPADGAVTVKCDMLLVDLEIAVIT
jgi:hypothetical protein